MFRALNMVALAGAGLVALAAGEKELTTGEIAAARKLYVGKCAKCHRFYEPKDYPESEWRRWMESMERKAKLKSSPAERLGRYLDAYRAGRIVGKPQDKPNNKGVSPNY